MSSSGTTLPQHIVDAMAEDFAILEEQEKSVKRSLVQIRKRLADPTLTKGQLHQLKLHAIALHRSFLSVAEKVDQNARELLQENDLSLVRNTIAQEKKK